MATPTCVAPAQPVYTFPLDGSEKCFPFAEVPAVLGEFTGINSTSVSVVAGWIYRGVHGTKLPTMLYGGKRVTTRSAVRWFLEQIQRGARPAVAS